MSFLFEATEQSQQRKRVVERVAARNGDSIENGIVVYLGDDTGENKLRERLAGHRAPTAGIVAAPAMMGTTGQIDGIAYPETVGDSLGVTLMM